MTLKRFKEIVKTMPEETEILERTLDEDIEDARPVCRVDITASYRDKKDAKDVKDAKEKFSIVLILDDC